MQEGCDQREGSGGQLVFGHSEKKCAPENGSAKITGIVSEGNYIRLWVKRFHAIELGNSGTSLLLCI